MPRTPDGAPSPSYARVRRKRNDRLESSVLFEWTVKDRTKRGFVVKFVVKNLGRVRRKRTNEIDILFG